MLFSRLPGQSNHLLHPRRTSFSLDLAFDLEVLGHGSKLGIRSSLDSTYGFNSGESHGNDVSVSGRVQGLDEKKLLAAGYTSEQIHAYGFGWKLGVWDSNLPTGETDKAGNPLYVPVVGYVVSNVTSLTHPVSGLEVEVKYDSINNPREVNISWDAPASGDGYPFPTAYNIYLVSDGEYQKIATLPGTAVPFIIPQKRRQKIDGILEKPVEKFKKYGIMKSTN